MEERDFKPRQGRPSQKFRERIQRSSKCSLISVDVSLSAAFSLTPSPLHPRTKSEW